MHGSAFLHVLGGLITAASATAAAPWGALYQRVDAPSSLSFLRLHTGEDVRSVPLDCGRPTEPGHVWSLAIDSRPVTSYLPCFSVGATPPQTFLGIDADGFIDSWPAGEDSQLEDVADSAPSSLAQAAFGGASLYPSLAVVGNGSSAWAVSVESPNVVFDYKPTETGGSKLRGAGWPVQDSVVLPSAVVSLQRRIEGGQPVLYIATKTQVYSYGLRTQALQLLADAPAGHEFFAVLAPQRPGKSLAPAPVRIDNRPAAVIAPSPSVSLRGAAAAQ